MLKTLRQLRAAIILIAATSGVLLLSDMQRGKDIRVKAETTPAFPRIAVMQITSTSLLDAHVAGIMDGLQAAGRLAPNRGNVRVYNPQGDYAIANAMAAEITKGDFDLIISSSTMALQIIAKANLTERKRHVFGAVTFPQGAGVGITGPGESEHPAWLSGIGTFQPVRRAFEIMHAMNPSVRRVGVVWNPGEQCSEACLNEARAACEKLGISLLEANAGNTAEVGDAVQSLLSRAIEAIWIGGDTVANASAVLIIRLARQAGIPVFTNDHVDAGKGALFGLGANYYTVGRYTAEMAAAILAGRSQASFRTDNVIPEKFSVNHEVLAKLAPAWRLTDDLRELEKAAPSPSPAGVSPVRDRPARVALCYFAPAPVFEAALNGFRERMALGGYREGKNLELIVQHANGDMSSLPQVTASLMAGNPDVYVPFSTPCLASAVQQGDAMKVVFGVVSAPLEAGAGTSFSEHLPNLTGSVRALPAAELFDRMRALFPGAVRIGALYNPGEPDSAKEISGLRDIFSTRGLALEAVPARNGAEASGGVSALLARKIDVVFLPADDAVVSAMPVIANACNERKIPMIADDSSLMGGGALMSCAPSPYACGAGAADLVVRVLNGESPEDIPFTPVRDYELTLDLAAARLHGVALPVDWLIRADGFYRSGARYGRPARVALINVVDNPSLSRAEAGFEAGMKSLGLRPGQDYTLRKYNAQGDMSALPQIFDVVQSGQPDLVATVTTPVLMAAVKRITTVPLVFTVASDPRRLNLFNNGRPANVCGVHDDPPVGALLDMAIRRHPTLKTVGTVYDPSQMNALISYEKLTAACSAKGIRLLERAGSAVSDLPMAVQALIQAGAEAIIVSADNLITTGFPAVSGAAAASNIPVFATEPALMEQGAAGCIGADYAAWGEQAGRMAARILAGVPPALMPIEPTRTTITAETGAETEIIRGNKAKGGG